MSGGPVLSTEGQLLAIHGRAELTTNATDQDDVRIRSGTSLGIPLDPALARLLALPLESRSSLSESTQLQSVRLRADAIPEMVFVRQPGGPCVIGYLYETGGIVSRCQ